MKIERETEIEKLLCVQNKKKSRYKNYCDHENGEWCTFALDAEHELSFVDIVGELVCGMVVAMGTDRTVKLQRVRVEPEIN